METDLPALCRRVWGKVPEAQPSQVGFGIGNFIVAYTCIDRNHAAVWHNVESMDPNTPAIKSLIQAACLRWLLENVAAMDAAKDGEAYFVDIYRRDGDWTISIANVSGPCLTTCLLLAVERCHEYKSAEAARGEK